jgi:serine/threonine protein kinase
VTEALPVLPPESAETLPKRFGKYTLIRRIAVGGMAELFLGIQRSMAGFEKLIVIKRILPKLAEDRDFIQMLLDEARIAATLTHPNIAQVFDVGVADGSYYIAMEHVHGEDLRSIVREMRDKGVTSFPLEHAIAIVLGSCAGLAYAHEKRDFSGEPLHIVHRDVSPQNLLVTFSGDIKLVDFGIAKAGRSAMEDTKSGKLKGKVPYMSPEQARGEPLDSRSDVFSLGVILFELCTGRRLFKSTSEYDTMRLIVDGSYPKPRSYNPSLPIPLERIIEKSIAKDRNARYQTALELQADLEAFVRSERLVVSPISVGNWMQKLFADKLNAQTALLQEGRQLAEQIATQISLEESGAHAQTLASGVRSRRPSRAPWIALTVLLLLLVAGGGAAAVWFAFLAPGADAIANESHRGVLQVESEPPGAAIWIDGERRTERTPATIEHMPLGATYAVKLSLDGYAPYTESVEITGASERGTVSATLERPTADRYAVVNLRTVPAGAHVLFDGTDTGRTTPTTIAEIAPDVEHSIVLALDGYRTKSMPVVLRAGQVEELALDLEPLPLGPNEALLRIVTEPDDARVLAGGEWRETGSPYEIRLPAERQRIVVARRGFRDEDKLVRLRGGEVTEVTVSLRAERRPSGNPGSGPAVPETSMNTGSGPGTLTFGARPWCNVTIDGAPAGQTPIVNRSLSAGNHRIGCTNPELGVSRNLTVEIQAGQATRRNIDLTQQ